MPTETSSAKVVAMQQKQAYAALHNLTFRQIQRGAAMYQQFNEQFAAATRQFADTAAQINRLALDNAEAVFGMQMSAMGNRANATFAFFGEAAGARDMDSLRTLWPKGVQVARENLESAVSTTQEVIGRQLKTQEEIANITKSQLEATTRRVGDQAQRAQSEFEANVAKATEQAQAASKASK
ncbi:phasin family protein [Lysobacter korlensis]|uniref:Phasin family protein n=1 Tax=Lysobacter korlensis TaxID=553636 RepID=A0ABV6RS02_9GAMM